MNHLVYIRSTLTDLESDLTQLDFARFIFEVAQHLRNCGMRVFFNDQDLLIKQGFGDKKADLGTALMGTSEPDILDGNGPTEGPYRGLPQLACFLSPLRLRPPLYSYLKPHRGTKQHYWRTKIRRYLSMVRCCTVLPTGYLAQKANFCA